MRQTALMTFLLVLAAHAFCFLNLTFSGASVMFNAAKGADAQIASGVYLQPFCYGSSIFRYKSKDDHECCAVDD